MYTYWCKRMDGSLLTDTTTRDEMLLALYRVPLHSWMIAYNGVVVSDDANNVLFRQDEHTGAAFGTSYTITTTFGGEFTATLADGCAIHTDPSARSADDAIAAWLEVLAECRFDRAIY